MISLVQVLITAVLVPVAFASSTSSAADPTPTHAAPAAATTCPVTRLPVSPDGQCGGGSGFGCIPGFCCSEHNYCGSTGDHCGMGCQPDVASCNPPSPLTGLKVSPDGTCGRGTNHKCGKGQCCSQYNRCGTGEEYCGDDCQNFFGTCDPPSDLRKVPVTTDARCGKEVNARCKGVECCSDDGYCGSDKDYCDAGCQPGYGLCNPLLRPQGLTVSPHGKCGRGSKFGCRPGFCCSRYNYCGLGEEYCDVGCQPLFGTCNPTSPAKSSSTKSGSGKRKHDGSSKPRSKKRRPGQHTDRKVKKDRSRSDKHVCISLLLFFWYLVTTLHRIQSGLVPAIQKSRLRLLGRALDPGVENVYTWLRGGVLNGEADLDQRWLDGTVEHESMGMRHDNRALAARLADFLQVAYRQYQSTLWKYHRDRLVEVG
ncbi:hypothetical protein BASA62_000001 [Batrachochytrium salamandrivorans]|nr:hypothetical protein BASA62_000001 [Batrachochytrium salamandrivorans]